MQSASHCRLCAGQASPVFELPILGRYPTRYWRCGACKSLQTDLPFWLDEAYASSLTFLDTFAGQRALNNLGATFLTAKLLGLKNIIDFGGNDGLLCRLLRDYGLNSYVVDKYAEPKYAQGFDAPNFSEPDLKLAFEVLEHLPNPSSDLDAVFSGGPKALLVSTVPYTGEGLDWFYLAPETGQHVFFYSPEALRLLARQRGYETFFGGFYTLFVRPELGARARWASPLLHRHSVRLMRALLSLMPSRGVQRDFERMRAAALK